MTIASLSPERINVALVGHVDHGKSTIVGRLLADSGALPEGKLAQVKAYCERNAKPFEYAFLVDALKSEKAQGVTIDAARVFFRLRNREYVLIDAPGHIEFVRNMVTGAARADGALLVIDAQEGIQENTRRHGALLSLLGIRQVVVLVNKMDLVSFRQEVFDKIQGDFSDFLVHWEVRAKLFIPVSGLRGDNIVERARGMPWYHGSTLREALSAFGQQDDSSEAPFRMWVQDVYKFTGEGDTRRIVAGTVQSGFLHVGDHLIFHPSGKKGDVRTIEAFNAPTRSVALAGETAGFTLHEKIFVSRGELAAKTEERKPSITSRLRVSLFWLGREPMVTGKEYTLKIGTARVACRLESVHSVQDGSSLELKKVDFVRRHEIADVEIQLGRALAFDLVEEIPATGRFVLLDQYEIRGGGIIRQALEDRETWVREKVLLRDYRWERSAITAEERAGRFRQKPAVLIITGKKDAGKKPLARAFEASLYENGYLPYFLGIGNILYGVDADIRGKAGIRLEHIRRLAEVAHVLLEGGFLVILTAIDLSQEDVGVFQAVVETERVLTVWLGEREQADLEPDMVLPEHSDISASIDALMTALRRREIIG
jgi:bifunctional enzyme CysN/CysC